jgi:hypothetical protein
VDSFTSAELTIIRSFPFDRDYHRIFAQINAESRSDLFRILKENLNRSDASHTKEFKPYEEKLGSRLRTLFPDSDEEILGFRIELAIEEVLNNEILGPLVASFIQKDAKKRNVAERCLEAYLEFLCSRYPKNIVSIKKLSNTELWINDGVLVPRRKPKKQTLKTKSIDFHLKTVDGRNFYIYHRHTDNEGGSQDTAKNDVLNTIQSCSACESTTNIFVFVCDGDYYNRERIEALKTQFNKHNLQICSTAELPLIFTKDGVIT